MGGYLATIDTRLHAIISGGYGSSGTPSQQLFSIPADRFRKIIHQVSLDDPSIAQGAFDRCYLIDWLSVEDYESPTNLLDGEWLKRLIFTLRVGYRYGKEATNFIKPIGGETPTVAATEWRQRALSDAERIARSLGWYENWAGLDPSLISVTRDGASSITDYGDGRGRVDTTYRLIVRANGATNYDP